jgi:hypothetical protein
MLLERQHCINSDSATEPVTICKALDTVDNLLSRQFLLSRDCMNIILSLQSPGLIHALILKLCMCSCLLFEQCFNMTSLWMPCHVDVSATASRDAKLYFAFLPLTLKFDFRTTLCDSQGSIVIIVSRLWAGWSGVWILAGERVWCLLQSCI